MTTIPSQRLIVNHDGVKQSPICELLFMIGYLADASLHHIELCNVLITVYDRLPG